MPIPKGITISAGYLDDMVTYNDFAVVLGDRPTTASTAPHLPLRRVPRRDSGHLPRNLGARGKFELTCQEW